MLQVWNEMQQDFNSRTCESCEYFEGGISQNNCHCEYSMGYTYTDLTKFECCNKWVPKTI